MATVPVHNVGALGIVRDLPDHNLPPEAWTDGGNVRFRDNKIIKFKGHAAEFDPPTVAPYWAMSIQAPAENVWLYMGLAKANGIIAGVHEDLTRAVGGDYTGGVDDYWNGVVFQAIPVITNGVDAPQFWAPVQTGQRLQDLTNWPAGYSTRIIRGFRGFLVALDVTDNLGSRFAHRVKWSHLADPGTLPSTWDETDATKDAGEIDLADTESGKIQEARILKDGLIIYKENAIHAMRFIGGDFIFRFDQILASAGALSRHCVVEYQQGKQHAIATGPDLITFDGLVAESVLDKRYKKFLQNNLDPATFSRAFLVRHPIENEVWYCFPSVGATFADLAIVWNWVDDTLGTRELNEAAFIALGIIEGVASTSWDSDAGSWDSDTGPWQASPFVPSNLELLQCDPTNTKLFRLDNTNQFNGTSFTSFVERTGLALVGEDRVGNPKVDMAQRKLVTRIWPKASGGPFDVRVGMQESIGGMITWGTLQSFDPSTQQYLDVCEDGRLIAIRFESSADVAWEVEGYDLEVVPLGAL